MDDFHVYVIHSSKPLTQLKDLLEQCGGYNYTGIIYKSMKSRSQAGASTMGSKQGGSKEETKKTIVFCPPHTIEQLVRAFPDFVGKVADYNWDSFPLPDESLGETYSLHISGVPNDYTDVEAQEFVCKALSVILPQQEKCENGTMKMNYKVDFPPRLRETGEISGYGRVTFSDHVDHEMIKLCKIILNNTPLSFKTDSKARRMVSCTWHRNQKMATRTNSSFADSVPRSEEESLVIKPSRARTTPSTVIRKARPAVIRVVDDEETVTQVDMSSLSKAKVETVSMVKK